MTIMLHVLLNTFEKIPHIYVVLFLSCFSTYNNNDNNNNGYFKCYFSGEHIAHSLKKNNNDVNIELGKNQQIKSTVHGAS